MALLSKTCRNKCNKPERDGAHVEVDGGKLVAASKMALLPKLTEFNATNLSEMACM